MPLLSPPRKIPEWLCSNIYNGSMNIASNICSSNENIYLKILIYFISLIILAETYTKLKKVAMTL